MALLVALRARHSQSKRFYNDWEEVSSLIQISEASRVVLSIFIWLQSHFPRYIVAHWPATSFRGSAARKALYSLLLKNEASSNPG